MIFRLLLSIRRQKNYWAYRNLGPPVLDIFSVHILFYCPNTILFYLKEVIIIVYALSWRSYGLRKVGRHCLVFRPFRSTDGTDIIYVICCWPLHECIRNRGCGATGEIPYTESRRSLYRKTGEFPGCTITAMYYNNVMTRVTTLLPTFERSETDIFRRDGRTDGPTDYYYYYYNNRIHCILLLL